MSTLSFHPNFTWAFVQMDPENVSANLKSLALPAPEIIVIEFLGRVANPQSWGRGGRRGSGMVLFESFGEFL